MYILIQVFPVSLKNLTAQCGNKVEKKAKYDCAKAKNRSRSNKSFSCSTQLSVTGVLLINLKILKIVNSFLLNIAEHEKFSANKYENANIVPDCKFNTSRKHTYIILTPLNPSFI